MPTPVQIKIIHTLKGALNLDEDTYRDVLATYGVASSKDLTPRKTLQLIQDLETKAQAAGVWKSKRKDFNPKNGADAMTMKIRALWAELHKAGKVEANTETALAAYVKRMTSRDSIRWCTTAQKIVLIEALKKWLER
ncbi:DUF1018 domain-containing protein [Geobacter pelophilus]|uniref:DUF1018 domain-containing protein n=1 Tax=Geoanaerobacter pelophilus TaxID=60036 RepID=A0AAW4L9U8_9BACT|nr:regulatory protein GemA [Geoanaerobacter pelophilus]MBT0666365.1 DUF1018 domain-containing protein [Geoanaerobacter pelophilus]